MAVAAVAPEAQASKIVLMPRLPDRISDIAIAPDIIDDPKYNPNDFVFFSIPDNTFFMHTIKALKIVS